MPIPVTLLYGGLSALLVTLLGVSVSLTRLGKNVSLGATVPVDVLPRVRAHGNAAEWVPLGIVLLLLLELAGAGSAPLHVCGGALLVGRILHAWAMYARRLVTKSDGQTGYARSRLSLFSATLNYIVYVGMSVYVTALHFMG